MNSLDNGISLPFLAIQRVIGYFSEDISSNLSGDFQVADEVREQLADTYKAAENGVIDAQTKLGIFHMSQFLCTSDKEAMSYFVKASHGGCTQAMVRLAILYNNARGIYKRDQTQAAYWLSKAATLQDHNGVCLNTLWHTEPLLPSLKIKLNSFIGTVQILDLAHREIGDAGISMIASILPKSRIHSLYLKGNKITDRGVSELAKTIFKSGVQILDLWHNEVSDQGLEILSLILPKTKIQVLDLAENKLTHLKALAKVLPNCLCLRVLYLGRNIIGGTDATLFSIGLEKSTIRLLDIGYNKLGSDGAVAIFQGAPPTMQILDLSENDLQNSGAIGIAKILPQKPNLRLLDLKKNGIGPEGGQLLWDTLASTNLEVLDLRLNRIVSLELKENLHPVLPQSLMQVNLKGNGIPANLSGRITAFINRRQKKIFPSKKRDLSILIPEGRVIDTLIVQEIKEIINNELDIEIIIHNIPYNTIKDQLHDKGMKESEILELLQQRQIFHGMKNVVVSVFFRSAEKPITQYEIAPYLSKINTTLEKISEEYSFQDLSQDSVDTPPVASAMLSFPSEDGGDSLQKYTAEHDYLDGNKLNLLSSI
ncbi:hypothetical protein [unidentified bacterial endosymbiont]|uniref:hypothetical protein n=1 Tax=unidentified bacterial endosymbiont TaxID=2355 RepID=UPI00209E2F05|nr:hypothetical protein [unidentified bacterial endosymbiont]